MMPFPIAPHSYSPSSPSTAAADMTEMMGALLEAMGLVPEEAQMTDEDALEDLLSGYPVYEVEELPSSERMLRSTKGNSGNRISISRSHELMFLDAVGALPESLEPGTSFRSVPASHIEDMELDPDKGHLLSMLDVVCDTRELGLFVTSGRADARDTYIGPISNKRAAAAHKMILREEAGTALSLMISETSNHRMDVGCEFAESIANELLCGRATISIANKKTKPLANVASKFDLMPAGNPKVCEETKILNLVSEAGRIWSEYAKMMGCSTILEAIGEPSHDPCSSPSMGNVRSWIAKFRETSGVEEGIKALFDGIPVEDIVS